tara:strand:+ start:73 stop:1149 length:1077 start_codon:yes stop_codon:yes gene_type:complete
MKPKKEKKVLVCMSGGVDSSVVAYLLQQEGYDVVGAFMKQWTGTESLSGVCTWKEDRRDAIRVASFLGVPLITLDFEKEYRDMVMTYFFQEYEKGRTPNPDVMCNKWIKFGFWLEKAQELGFDFLATGHYAKIIKTKTGEYDLGMARDEKKDQTYFLHQLDQSQLSHVLFPLGDITKSAVRQIARKAGLPTAERGESMGMCFVGKVPMEEFLLRKIQKNSGNIVHAQTGKVLGKHKGLAFYTIGQRHGVVGIGGGRPLFVVQKKMEENILVVGYDDDPQLKSLKVRLGPVHWISGHPSVFPLQCKVRLRHGQALQSARIVKKNQFFFLLFSTPQRAVTSGQFAVFYHGDICLGGAAVH